MNPTDAFEAHRAHILGLAYRMLGDMAAAEDIAQEAWLRWQRADTHDVRNLRAWLSAVTTRLCLDELRSARARREKYVGPWLPEPLMPDDMRALAADSPAANAELASDLSLALLHVLERLNPEERAALILHDAFDCDYAEIAATLDKTQTACRKLVSRARERVKTDRPRFHTTAEQHRDFLARFSQALTTQDAKALGALLAPGAIAYTDGGGRVAAALNPIRSAEKVTRFIIGLSRKFMSHVQPEYVMTEINGTPSLVLIVDGAIYVTLTIACDDTQITALYMMRNPEKLMRLSRGLIPSDSAVRPSSSRGSSSSV